MTIYERIRDLAKQKNMSIRELENTLGYSNGSLRKWTYSAPSNKLSEVANFFNVSIDFLIGRKEKDDTLILGRKMDSLSKEQIRAIQALIKGYDNDDK